MQCFGGVIVFIEFLFWCFYFDVTFYWDKWLTLYSNIDLAPVTVMKGVKDGGGSVPASMDKGS